VLMPACCSETKRSKSLRPADCPTPPTESNRLRPPTLRHATWPEPRGWSARITHRSSPYFRTSQPGRDR
jgi:hypothetical protein